MASQLFSVTHTAWGSIRCLAAGSASEGDFWVLHRSPQTSCTKWKQWYKFQQERILFSCWICKPGSHPALLTQSKTSHSSLKGPQEDFGQRTIIRL